MIRQRPKRTRRMPRHQRLNADDYLEFGDVDPDDDPYEPPTGPRRRTVRGGSDARSIPLWQFLAADLQQYTSRRIVALGRHITRDLYNATPVDTGWARSNWLPQISRTASAFSFSRITGVFGTLYNEVNLDGRRATQAEVANARRRQLFAIRNLSKAVRRARASASFTLPHLAIINRVPYINVIGNRLFAARRIRSFRERREGLIARGLNPQAYGLGGDNATGPNLGHRLNASTFQDVVRQTVGRLNRRFARYDGRRRR